MKQEDNCKNKHQVVIFSPLILNFIVTKKLLPKYNCIPLHYIILRWCTTDTHRRVFLQSKNYKHRMTSPKYEILPPADIIYQ